MDKSTNNNWTVAQYLATRLEQLGIKYVFGVPGNHLGPFLSTMQATTSLRWRGNTNEINGGYAADGYARVKGVSAVGVTYGVGALSLINTVGGAFVEHVPMIVINAAPTLEQHLNYQAIGLLTSHMSPNKQSNIDAYRQVTVDAQRITNNRLAPTQIDAAITACLTEMRPIYLEVFQDVWDEPCVAPEGILKAAVRSVKPANVAKAVKATIELIKTYGRPIFWGGIEIDRLNLAKEFEALIDATGIPYCTSIMGKSIISEKHPRFHGIYNGNASLKQTYRMFNCAAKCKIGLGAWTTSKNMGGTQAMGTNWVTADHEGVRVGTNYFPNVQLGAFIVELQAAIQANFKEGFGHLDYYQLFAEEVAKQIEAEKPKSRGGKKITKEELFEEIKASYPGIPMTREHFLKMLSNLNEDPNAGLTYDGFFTRISQFIGDADKAHKDAAGKTYYTNPYGIVSDAGFSLLGSQNVVMAAPKSYFSQTSWLSIGYSVGSATGLKSAFSEDKENDKRMMVFVGDGAFQETCQAMSSHTRHRQNNIVFIMNNEHFYGIEQMLVKPTFYSTECKEAEDFYNDLHPWEYAKLAAVFHTKDKPMTGHVIKNYADLERLLAKLSNPSDAINKGPNIVQLLLKKEDYPSSIGYKVAGACGAKPSDPCADWREELRQI